MNSLPMTRPKKRVIFFWEDWEISLFDKISPTTLAIIAVAFCFSVMPWILLGMAIQKAIG